MTFDHESVALLGEMLMSLEEGFTPPSGLLRADRLGRDRSAMC